MTFDLTQGQVLLTLEDKTDLSLINSANIKNLCGFLQKQTNKLSKSLFELENTIQNLNFPSVNCRSKPSNPQKYLGQFKLSGRISQLTGGLVTSGFGG